MAMLENTPKIYACDWCDKEYDKPNAVIGHQGKCPVRRAALEAGILSPAPLPRPLPAVATTPAPMPAAAAPPVPSPVVPQPLPPTAAPPKRGSWWTPAFPKRPDAPTAERPEAPA